MRVDINRLLWPIAIFVIATLVLFVAFPLQIKDEGSVYDYSVNHDIPKTKVNYTAPILTALLAVVVFFWITMTFTDQELSISRTGNNILKDPTCADQLSSHRVYFPLDITTEIHLGDFPQGSLKFLSVINQRHAPVFAIAIANDNYSTTEARQRFESPIISISEDINYCIETGIRVLKPSMRRTDMQRFKETLMSLKKNPKLKEMYEDAAKEEIEEEGGEDEG